MDDDMQLVFKDIINMVETRRNNAYRKVNEELISLYWDFGKYISEKVNDSNWGDKIVDKLVGFMKREYPTMIYLIKKKWGNNYGKGNENMENN